MKGFNSLFTLAQKFNTEKAAIKYLYNLRWEDGFACPHCSFPINPYIIKKDLSLFRCRKCQKNFTVRIGTMFEKSKISLQKWFYAIYLLNLHKKGISSCQLARDLGITQKTAYYMLQKIRFAIAEVDIQNNNKMNGEVEIDEAYIGGKEQNKHSNKKLQFSQGGHTKDRVLGMLEREGRLILRYFPRHEPLKPIIDNNLSDNAIVFTDESPLYSPRSLGSRIHAQVNHKKGEYVRYNIITTNGIEGIFGLFKRSVYGIYHHVSRKHLNKYTATFAFKYNNRNCSIQEQFDLSLKSICKVRNVGNKNIIS